MKKEAYYFSHDANARNDVKLLKVRRQLGAEGYAIYFMIIEVLREQVNYKLPLTSIADLAYDFDVSEEKVKTIVCTYDLFQMDENEFFSSRLLRSMEDYNQRKTKYIEAGRKGGQASVKHRLSNPQALKERKGKEKKEKKYIPASPETIKSFYENQIATNQSGEFIEGYKKMVDYLYGKNPLKAEYKNVLAVRDQVSYDQFVSMKEKSEETGVTIKQMLDSMNNRVDLCKNNLSVSATAMNWMRRDYKKSA